MEKETKHTLGKFSITDNLTAVINSQADRIIEAENSGKALLRIIERLEGQISEMKKENASLQPENTRLKSELLHRDVTVLPQKDFEFEEMKASLQSEIDRLNQENEGIRKEIMEQGDTIVSLGKVLLKPSEKEELSEMKKEREELIQGKGQVISMCIDLIEICERHLPMAGAPSDWMTVREVKDAIKK